LKAELYHLKLPAPVVKHTIHIKAMLVCKQKGILSPCYF